MLVIKRGLIGKEKYLKEEYLFVCGRECSFSTEMGSYLSGTNQTT